MKTMTYALILSLTAMIAAAGDNKIETLIQQPGKVQNFESKFTGQNQRLFTFELIGTAGDMVTAGVEVRAKTDQRRLNYFTLGAEGILSQSVLTSWDGLQRYLAQYCLGLTKAQVSTIKTWVFATRATIAKSGQGKFVKQFGDTTVQISSSFFVDNTSSIHIQYQRNATPGAKNWEYYCVFE